MITLASAEDGAPVSAREISERQAIPSRFLEQLLVSLRRAGLVSAVRGARGGFTLARTPSAISVLEVVEALEGPLSPTACDGDRSAICGRLDACAAGRMWERATRALRDVFAETTLAQLAQDQERLDSRSSA